MTPRELLLEPLAGPAIGLVLAAAGAVAAALRFEGKFRLYVLYYTVPCVVPAAAFVHERLLSSPGSSLGQWVADSGVAALSLLRMVVPIPWISGHALFLTYVLLTASFAGTQVTAGVVLLEVAYLKIFVWKDTTILGGAALGGLAAIWFRGI